MPDNASAPVAPQDEPQPPSAPTVDVRALRAAAEAALAVGAFLSPEATNEEVRAHWYVWGQYQDVADPRVVLALLDRFAALEAALLTRVPMRNHGSAIVCGCCDGALALEQTGPGCCEMTGLHEAGCAVAELITADMARAALGREEASRE